MGGLLSVLLLGQQDRTYVAVRARLHAMSERARLPDSWATGEAHPKQIARELHRQLGPESTMLVYSMGGGRPRYYICRFLDNGRGLMLRDQQTGEIYENPRPWSRPLEILGVADTMAQVLWILKQGKPTAIVASKGGVKPRLDGSGNWVGFTSAGNIELSAGLLDLIL
jgi:hypothetical protein